MSKKPYNMIGAGLAIGAGLVTTLMKKENSSSEEE